MTVEHKPATSLKDLVGIDVPIELVEDIIKIVIDCRGTVGFIRTFRYDDGIYDSMLVDLASLPAIIEALGIGPLGYTFTEDHVEELAADDPAAHPQEMPEVTGVRIVQMAKENP